MVIFPIEYCQTTISSNLYMYYPEADMNALVINGHRSYIPVVMSGKFSCKLMKFMIKPFNGRQNK